MTIDEKLRELESKEAKLKRGKETAAYSQLRGRRTTRQDYPTYDKSRSRSPRCYLYKGNYLIKNCTVLQDLKQIAKGVKYLKRTTKSASTSRSSRPKATVPKPKPKPKPKAKPTSDNNDAIDIDKYGYNAEDIDEDSDEDQVSADSSEYETEPEETSAISTEVNTDDSTEQCTLSRDIVLRTNSTKVPVTE
jgi:hypothetical protein